MDLQDLRKYRFQLDSSPYLNNKNDGIALFDFIGTFMLAYFLEHTFNLTKKLSAFSNINVTSKMYYVSIIPIAIIVHYLTNTKTFLNTKISSSDINIYKIILLISLILGVVTF